LLTAGLFSLFAALLVQTVSADEAGESWAPSTFTLGNGMDVIVVPDHRAPVVTHMVWYKVGAADEAPSKSGIAHLFEHVMFKSTDDLEDGEFDQTVTSRGGQLNAFTSWDYTAYFERVAKQHLPKMMELEAERMMDLIIDEDPEGAFITERDVVKEERRQRIENNPSALLSEKVLSTYWAGHPYEITVIGLMDEVSALTPQDGIDFYQKYYSPENAILVVAGDVTADEVRDLAEQYYGSIEPSGLVDGERAWRPVEPLSETVEIIHRDPKVRQPVWYRYYDGTSLKRDRDFALELEVGLQVLGGGNTSLLFQRLVEEQKLAVNVGSGVYSFLHDEGPSLLYATPSPGVDIDALEAAVMAEIAVILEEGFADKDVERVKNKLAATAIYQRDSQTAMAREFGAWAAIGGDIQEVLSYPDDVRSVTTDQAIAAVRSILAADKPYIEAMLLPEGDGQ
ncbi:MAG: pitrilysin family protein, partial [Pseudomonadota bacterium]